MTLKLRVAVHTDVGVVRNHNEDTVGINGWALQGDDTLAVNLDLTATTTPQRIAVCDGMGGHVAGALASRTAAKLITRPGPGDRARSIHEADRHLFNLGKSEPTKAGLGTTCVLLETQPDGRATIYHVGDSRAYLVVDRLIPLTRDDRLAPDSPGLTQALGGGHAAVLEVHQLALDLYTGQQLLLCSDGLVDVVPEQHINTLLQRTNPVDELIAAARAGGGPDNITAVLIEVVHSPLTLTPADEIEL